MPAPEDSENAKEHPAGDVQNQGLAVEPLPLPTLVVITGTRDDLEQRAFGGDETDIMVGPQLVGGFADE